MDVGHVFYFGRGSSDCIRVEKCPGMRFEVGVGNGKTREGGGGSMVLMPSQLHQLGEFFMTLWQEHGQDMYVEKLVDDPHDSILVHDFDFSQVETL